MLPGTALVTARVVLFRYRLRSGAAPTPKLILTIDRHDRHVNRVVQFPSPRHLEVAEYNGFSVVLSDLPACHPATVQKQSFLDRRTHAICSPLTRSSTSRTTVEMRWDNPTETAYVGHQR
jgi:hypothetical protein